MLADEPQIPDNIPTELDRLLERFGLVLTDDPEFDHDEQTFGKAKDAFVNALRLSSSPVEEAPADVAAKLAMFDTVAADPDAWSHGALVGAVLQARDIITRLSADLAEARKVIEFYSDPENWHGVYMVGCGSMLDDWSDVEHPNYPDGKPGKCARQWLSQQGDQS
jgi:hypothetical protein